MMLFRLLHVSVMAFASIAPAAQDPTYLLCRSNKTVRTIRVEELAGGVCRTQYTKEGVEKTVANSRAIHSCRSVMSNIKNNLEKASWTCKDISSAKISSDEASAGMAASP